MTNSRGLPVCVGLMLAAGFARRYGSDKRSARLADGTALLVASVQAAQRVVDELWLVVRPEDDLEALGIGGHPRVVRCANAHEGMGHSLACGAHAISQHSSADALMVLLGDMPWLGEDTLQLLHSYTGEACIVVPVHGGQPGHPVIFGRRFWPDLLALDGDQGARRIIQANPRAVVRVEVKDPGVILDVDTPEALACGPGEKPD